jgi:hypothetical protein
MRPLLATLVGLGLLTAGLSEARQRKSRDEGRSRIADEGVAMRLLPGGGGQSTVPADFCGLFSEHLVGNHFCLNGDGTSTSGMVDGGTAMQLVDAGSPTTYTAPLCPSGANCAPASYQRLNGTSQHYQTADVASPSGSFTCCAGFRADVLSGNRFLVAKDSSEAGGRGPALYIASGGTLNFDVYKADGAGTSRTGGTPSVRAAHFGCGAYEFVADGTSRMTTYLDGVASTTTTTAVGPPQPSAMTYWAVGRREYAALPDRFSGLVGPAFCTEKVLDAATILDMSRAATGLLSGSWGEAVTFTRTSPAPCYDESGQYLTQLPAGRPCVSRMSLAGRPAVTNLQIRSEELGNAAWTTTSANVGTADQHIAPDGSRTAETVTSTGAGGRLETTTAVAVGAASAAGSLWVKTTTGTQAGALVVRKTTATAADICTAEFTATTEWQQVGCFGATTSGHSHTLRIYPGGVAGTGTIVAWGAQLAAAAYLPDYCGPTAGTSLTCAAESATVPTAGWPVGGVEYCATVRPQWTVPPALAYVFDSRTGAGATDNGSAMYVDTAGRLCFLSRRLASQVNTCSTNALTWAAGTPYRVCAEHTAAGNLAIRRDDVTVGAVTNGTQVVPEEHAATAKVGANVSSTNQLAGRISDLVVRRR